VGEGKKKEDTPKKTEKKKKRKRRRKGAASPRTPLWRSSYPAGARQQSHNKTRENQSTEGKDLEGYRKVSRGTEF